MLGDGFVYLAMSAQADCSNYLPRTAQESANIYTVNKFTVDHFDQHL